MAKEFTVQLEDRPGSLADLTEALAKHAINIVAIHATPCPTSGIVQFVTDNTDATVTALKHVDKDYTTRDVLIVNLPHQPGAMAQLSRALANADININAVYMTMAGQIVLDVSDVNKAQRVAINLGIREP